jgi:micrococcal nuclease
MNGKTFRPAPRPISFKPSRRGFRRAVLLIPLLGFAGALFDPSLIAPFGPLAVREEVTATFTRCGPGGSGACVIDGGMVKLGDRTIRIVGIDAPKLNQARCPAEAARARRSAGRLLVRLNQGPFDMVAHRLQRMDRRGHDLMALERGGKSIGGKLIDEGLAKRYFGLKRSWC